MMYREELDTITITTERFEKLTTESTVLKVIKGIMNDEKLASYAKIEYIELILGKKKENQDG